MRVYDGWGDHLESWWKNVWMAGRSKGVFMNNIMFMYSYNVYEIASVRKL